MAPTGTEHFPQIVPFFSTRDGTERALTRRGAEAKPQLRAETRALGTASWSRERGGPDRTRLVIWPSGEVTPSASIVLEAIGLGGIVTADKQGMATSPPRSIHQALGAIFFGRPSSCQLVRFVDRYIV